MERKANCSRADASNRPHEERKPFPKPELTKYGTVKDVYSGPSCKAVMAKEADK